MTENLVQRVDTVFTEEALKANDGKKLPLTLEPGGPVIGEATLRYDSEEKALKAVFEVYDPKIGVLFTDIPPLI